MHAPRWLWITVAVLGVLAMVVVGPGQAWVNSYVHTDSFREEVERQAGAAAGGEVTITQIHFSIWRGVRLMGLALKLNSPQGTVTAQIESVNCACSWLAFLRGRVQLDRVTLDKPDLVLTQQPPSSVPTPSTGKPSTSHGTESAKTPPLQIVLEAAKISDGGLSIHDAAGAMKADLQKIDLYADTGGFYTGGAVDGNLKIGRIALPKNLALTDFSTPFKYQAGAMEADPFEATAFGGEITGHYHLDPGSPSTLDVNATNLDVGEIGQTANPGSATSLTGRLALQSTWHGVESGALTGEGDAQISHGKLRGVSLLQTLADTLRIRNLAEPSLKSVATHFEVAGGTTHFSHLKIESDDFDLAGDGTISPDGQLDANLVLTLHGGAMGGVTGLAASFFSQVPGGGGSIPIHLTGNVANPHSNLSPELLNPAPRVRKVEHALDKAISHLF